MDLHCNESLALHLVGNPPTPQALAEFGSPDPSHEVTPVIRLSKISKKFSEKSEGSRRLGEHGRPSPSYAPGSAATLVTITRSVSPPQTPTFPRNTSISDKICTWGGSRQSNQHVSRFPFQPNVPSFLDQEQQELA